MRRDDPLCRRAAISLGQRQAVGNVFLDRPKEGVRFASDEEFDVDGLSSVQRRDHKAVHAIDHPARHHAYLLGRAAIWLFHCNFLPILGRTILLLLIQRNVIVIRQPADVNNIQYDTKCQEVARGIQAGR
jgi:hypothetical protein